MQQPSRESSSVSSSDSSRRFPAEMRRQSMSAIRCGAAAAVDSCGDASACSVNGGEGGAAEAAAEAAVASRDVRARWARYARSSSAVFRSRLRSCACEGGGVGGVHLGSRAALGVCACLDGGLQVVDQFVRGGNLAIAEEARGHWKLRLRLQYSQLTSL